MAWSKVVKGKKPIKWWFYKILCEIAWSLGSDKYYYSFLDSMTDHGFNLYGEPFPKFKGPVKSPKSKKSFTLDHD